MPAIPRSTDEQHSDVAYIMSRRHDDAFGVAAVRGSYSPPGLG